MVLSDFLIILKIVLIVVLYCDQDSIITIKDLNTRFNILKKSFLLLSNLKHFMKKTFLKLSFVSFVLLFTLSCKKNSSSKSKTELLTQKAWVQSNQEIGSGGNWQTDPVFASTEACNKDDHFVFKADKTYEVNEGATKCDESAKDIIEQGNWNFEDNETKLNFSGGTVTLTQLDESTLIFTVPAPQNSALSYRATFKH